MVVIAIMLFFAALLVGAYGQFMSGFRSGTALTRLESALHYARNLAIANNTVYHIRFENVNLDPTAGVVGTPLNQQTVSIYCFPDMATALSVTTENLSGGTVWNPYPILVSPTGNHNNYRVANIDMPPGTYFGLQYLTAAASPYDAVIYFKPDGTCYFNPDGTGNRTVTMFVTDNLDFADDRSLQATTFNLLQGNRRAYFNTRAPSYLVAPVPTGNQAKHAAYLKMIQVFQGGMIRIFNPAGGVQL